MQTAGVQAVVTSAHDSRGASDRHDLALDHRRDHDRRHDVRPRRHLVGAGAALAAGAAGLLPWHRSGDAVRNGFEIVASAHRLSLATDGFAAAIAVVWFLVPAIAASSVTLALLGSRRIASVLAVVAGAASVCVATIGLLAPGAIVVGPLVSAAMGLVACIAGAQALLAARPARTSTNGGRS